MRDDKLTFTEAFWDSEQIIRVQGAFYNVVIAHTTPAKLRAGDYLDLLQPEFIQTPIEPYCMHLGEYLLLIPFGYEPTTRILAFNKEPELWRRVA